MNDWARDHQPRPDRVEAAPANPFITTPSPDQRLKEGGRQSVLRAHETHERLVDERGIGLFYGAASRFARLTREAQALVLDLKLPDHLSHRTVLEQLERQTCISWAMRHVAAAYRAAGRADRFVEIAAAVAADDMRGTALARALQEDGWTALFFVPDRRRLTDHTAYGRHALRALEKGAYHGVTIDDTVVDYRRKKSDKLARLARVPFFFGLVKSGGHVFAGADGQVSEMHWNHGPGSRRAVERRPLDDAGFHWSEGLLMLPPGTWRASDR